MINPFIYPFTSCYDMLFFFFQAEDGIRARNVTGVQTCALPISVDGQVLAGPDEDGFFELPLLDGQTIELEVANVGRLPHGSFTMAKSLDGVDEAAVPEDLAFPVTWTATYPDGSTLSGSTVLRAGAPPVPPTDADGEPLTFPQGTTVTFDETRLPELPGWTW